ncbi:MAG: LysM peptidoglycan-binding domain-containing protein [Bacillota bacterium]|jgi:LysM repeat protein|nr:LysM peptidoglycan-binding domain-containing protein [Bacillota bacterium]
MRKRYRLKNRKKFAAFLFCTALMLLYVGSVSLSNAGNIMTEYRSVTVNHGDTLWEIAGKYRGGTEIREYIYKIKKMNNLDSALIYAGQTLNLP